MEVTDCFPGSRGGSGLSIPLVDIVQRPVQVKVYTFGCPRVGNHCFAREYEACVPDTWHIINNQDIVTRSMKVWGMYNRAGQRVIVNAHGDLVVRPTFLELSLLQVRFGHPGFVWYAVGSTTLCLAAGICKYRSDRPSWLRESVCYMASMLPLTYRWCTTS